MSSQRRQADRDEFATESSDAIDVVDALLADPRWCSWCFTQLRECDPEYDHAEAKTLSVGDTKHTFDAKGHRIREDGTVNPSRSYRTTEAADIVEGQLYCGECGRPDGDDAGGQRNKDQLHGVFDALVDALDIEAEREAVEAGHDAINRSYDEDNQTERISLAKGLARTLESTDGAPGEANT